MLTISRKGIRFENVPLLKPFIFKFDCNVGGSWSNWRIVKLDNDGNILQYQIIANKITELSLQKWNDRDQICYLEK